MNYRQHHLELNAERSQIQEALSAIFHTVLLHRTTPKVQPTNKEKGVYSRGKLGMTDVVCNFIDCTYVRVTSKELQDEIQKEINDFVSALHNTTSGGTKYDEGEISLEFFTRKDAFFNSIDNGPWERWTVKVEIETPCNERERQVCRENVSSQLMEKLIYINKEMNKHEFTPGFPVSGKLNHVYSVKSDVMTYLYQITMTPSRMKSHRGSFQNIYGLFSGVKKS